VGCVCAQKLMTALENLKQLPLAALAGAVPQPLPTAQMAAVTGGLVASMGCSASAMALAQMAASAKLSANLTMSTVAQLEAMAYTSTYFGVNPLAPGAAAKLSLTVQSMNSNLPKVMAAMLGLLAPFAAQLAALSQMLTTSAVVKQVLGVDLLQPGGAGMLSAAFQAHASAVATASASASASAVASLVTHARLVAAAQALGVQLGTPGGIQQLSGLLSMSATLKLPSLVPSGMQMGNLAAALAPIQAVKSSLSITLKEPNLAALLAQALGLLGQGMAAVAGLNAKALASAKATASASAVSSAALQAAATIDFRGMVLPPGANLGMISGMAALTEQMMLGGGSPMAQSPCSSCPVGGAF